MEEDELIIEPSDICNFCDHKMDFTDMYCLHCGFPENGGYKEKNYFKSVRYRIIKRNEAMHKKISSARNLLFIIAGLAFLVGILSYGRIDGIAILITNLILATIYVLLGIWSNREPIMALLMALFLFIMVMITVLLEDPMSMFKGIIWKILILYFLIKGVQNAMILKPNYDPLNKIPK